MVYKKSLALSISQLHKQALGSASVKVPAWPRADPPSPLPSLHFCGQRSKDKTGRVSWVCKSPWGGVPSDASSHLPCLSAEAETPTESLPEPEGGDKEEVEGGDQPTTPPEPQTSSECLTLFLPGALSLVLGGWSHVFRGQLM